MKSPPNLDSQENVDAWHRYQAELMRPIPPPSWEELEWKKTWNDAPSQKFSLAPESKMLGEILLVFLMVGAAVIALGVFLWTCA